MEAVKDIVEHSNIFGGLLAKYRDSNLERVLVLNCLKKSFRKFTPNKYVVENTYSVTSLVGIA